MTKALKHILLRFEKDALAKDFSIQQVYMGRDGFKHANSISNSAMKI